MSARLETSEPELLRAVRVIARLATSHRRALLHEAERSLALETAVERVMRAVRPRRPRRRQGGAR